MPEQPNWDFIKQAAAKITDKPNEVYGICLRGKPGWGENMAVPDHDGQLVRRALVRRELEAGVQRPAVEGDAGDLSRPDEELRAARRHRPTGSTRTWRCSSPASAACGSMPRSPPRSCPIRRTRRSPTRSASRRRRAARPARTPTGCGRGRSRSRPVRSRPAAAEKFIAWATGKDYLDLVAAKDGWANVPPGTRKSLYANPEYLKAAPFAKLTLEGDRLGQSRQGRQFAAEALYRRAVRRDPRVPGHRDRRRPAIRRRARRPEPAGAGAGERAER